MLLFLSSKGSYFQVDVAVQSGFGVPNDLWAAQGFTLDSLRELGDECHAEAKHMKDSDPWSHWDHLQLLDEPQVVVQPDAIHIYWERYCDELIDLGTAA